ncbi:MAG: hypothetical protein JW969_05320 [Spirochaetales bacterium]|nr:hypothetical protein [Spirochaetales bacterium]
MKIIFFSPDLPIDAGLQYGRLTGDGNMVHINDLTAKLFGFRKPFIQGYCTANLVMKHLSQKCRGGVIIQSPRYSEIHRAILYLPKTPWPLNLM